MVTVTGTENIVMAAALAEGETAVDTFTVTVTDDFGATDSQTVSITVTGNNDAPTISGSDAGTVSEDGTLTAGGAAQAASRRAAAPSMLAFSAVWPRRFSTALTDFMVLPTRVKV